MDNPKFKCSECDNEVEEEGGICDECFYGNENDNDEEDEE